jgi:serine/threonine-protein kinase
MGAVYLAGRADEQYEKLVAIKVIQAGRESEEMLQRFRRERQILASLEHPNIARLLDGGSTDEGLPYFVMDYIEGTPIDSFCARHGLSVVERLRLFLVACSAVAHAHRNLIVHRDLKPGNILVTSDGVPKLLDFGLAKLTAPELPGETATGTLFAFTPAYASPEQVRGEPVTTATDVYSLGVVLYELLTGHSPYRAKTRDTVDVLKVICEQEPERPSTAVVREAKSSGSAPAEAERLRRSLRGDLDSIVLKALRKEPKLRYQSVDAFAEDIRHHLEARPVAARKGTKSYRAGKFVRRHWIGVSAAGLVLAAIIGGAVLATYGLVRARRAEAEALQQAGKATAINQYLQQILFAAQPHQGRGRQMTVVEALAAAVPQIEASFRDQPEIRAAVQHTIGRTYLDLGLYGEAEGLLRQSHATRRQVLGPEHPDVAESLESLGALAYEKGDFKTAESLFREALQLRRRSLGNDALPVAESLNDLGMTLEEGMADYPAAQPLLEEALAIKRSRLGNRNSDVAQSLNNLGMLHYRKKDYAKAEPLLREALTLHRELVGNESADVAAALNNLALVLTSKGDYAGAAQLLRQAVDINRKVLGPEHPDVASNLNSLALALQKVGRHQEAEIYLRGSVEIWRKNYPDDHFLIATTRNLLGGCLTEMGRYAEAEPLLTLSYAIILKQFGPDHPRTRAARNRVVQLYQAWGKPQRAAAYQPVESRRP